MGNDSNLHQRKKINEMFAERHAERYICCTLSIGDSEMAIAKAKI